MVINPPLILVSALFFLALTSMLYLGSWAAVSVILRAGYKRLSHAANKRLLMASLVLPPLLALIPTLGGATLRHSHETLTAEHHSPACRQMFVHLFSAETMTGPEMTISSFAGKFANGLSWLLLGVGLFLLLRLLWATIRLESGLTPYLNAPSARLTASVTRISGRLPRLPADRFYECALPATYSSVLGLRRVRCVLSREFVAEATEDELDAVVAHEANHLSVRDVPATLSVGALNCLFFALRPVRLLARRWREEAELASDDAAVAVTGQPLALAAAILRAVGSPVSPPRPSRSLPAVAMPFADETACSASKRVERLLVQAQEAALPAPRESPRQIWAGWAVTFTFAGLGMALLISPQIICYAHCALETVSRLLP